MNNPVTRTMHAHLDKAPANLRAYIARAQICISEVVKIQSAGNRDDRTIKHRITRHGTIQVLTPCRSPQETKYLSKRLCRCDDSRHAVEGTVELMGGR